MSIITMFAGFVTAAIANVKRPDNHKRLMLLATLVIMPPALIRMGLIARLLRGLPAQTALATTFGRGPATPAVGLAVGTVAAVG